MQDSGPFGFASAVCMRLGREADASLLALEVGGWEGMVVWVRAGDARVAVVSDPIVCVDIHGRLLAPRIHYYLADLGRAVEVVDGLDSWTARAYGSYFSIALSCLGDVLRARLGIGARALWLLQAGVPTLVCVRARRWAPRCFPFDCAVT